MQVNEKAGAQRQAASLEHLLTTCQADANAKTQELQASQAASKIMSTTLLARLTLGVLSGA